MQQSSHMAGSYFFEKVHDLTAASRGEPGNRFFFVVAGTEEGWVRVWMEKEQLRALAEGFDELIEKLGGGVEGGPPRVPADEPSTPMLGEFLALRLAVGYDEDRDALVLLAHADGDDDDAPTLACRVTKQQAATLARQAIAVCDAGRPMCTMCDQPIEPDGHLCPKSNGHRRSGL